MSKRKADADDAIPRNESGKVLFVRDGTGELCRVLPGEALPANAKAASDDSRDAVAEAQAHAEDARLANRSEEEVQYDAYVNGRDAKKGNVWIAGAGVASSDRAAFADSISAQVAEEREREGLGPAAPTRRRAPARRTWRRRRRRWRRRWSSA